MTHPGYLGTRAMATVRSLAAVIHEDGAVGQTPASLVARATKRAPALRIGETLTGFWAEQLAGAMLDGIRAADQAAEPMTGGMRR